MNEIYGIELREMMYKQSSGLSMKVMRVKTKEQI